MVNKRIHYFIDWTARRASCGRIGDGEWNTKIDSESMRRKGKYMKVDDEGKIDGLDRIERQEVA